MNGIKLTLTGLFAGLALVAAGCGGGGGGGGGVDPSIPDPGADPTQPTLNFEQVTVTQDQGATFGAVVDINESSQVVGYSNDTEGDTHPLIWELDTTTATTGSPSHLELLPGGTFGAAHGVNESGMVVGESQDTNLNLQAMFWSQGSGSAASNSLLPALDAGSQFSAAYGINNTGMIVGESQNAAGNTMPVVWAFDDTAAVTGPTVLPLPAGGVSGSAYFVTDTGKVVGEYSDGTNDLAVLWMADSTGAMVATDLGAMAPAGFGDSAAYGVNENDLIIGEAVATADGAVHGILWDMSTETPTVTDLGSQIAESNTYGINDFGRMAGWIGATLNGDTKASVWDARSATVSNFSTLFATAAVSQGYAVNNLGTVVGISGGLPFVAVQR